MTMPQQSTNVEVKPESKEVRPIHQIAKEIEADWKKTSKSGVYFGAVPYLDAMKQLVKPTDNYGQDRASMIVNYFLANAQTYRGEKAKALKAELKALVKNV